MISQLCLFGLQFEGNYFLLVSAAVLGERVPPHITRPRDGSCAPHSLLGTCNPPCHGALCTLGLSLVSLLVVPSSPALLFVMSSHTPTAAAFRDSVVKNRNIWKCQKTGQFCRLPFLPSFLPSISLTHLSSRIYSPLCYLFSSLGAILAHFSQGERWNRCGRVCGLSCLASAVLRELWQCSLHPDIHEH